MMAELYSATMAEPPYFHTQGGEATNETVSEVASEAVSEAASEAASEATSDDATPLVTDRTWEEDARAMQQTNYEWLGDSDWCSFHVLELDYLRRKIGFALFGPPGQEPNAENANTGYNKEQLEEIITVCNTIEKKDNHSFSKSKNLYNSVGQLIFGGPDVEPHSTNEMTGYSHEKLSHIKKILELVKKCDQKKYNFSLQKRLERYVSTIKNRSTKNTVQDICKSVHNQVALEEIVTWLSIVLVIMNVEFEGRIVPVPEPVFRVPFEDANGIESHIFIDRNKRVYEGWDKYLKNNKLPACTYCYPTNGVYTGDQEDKVLVEFAQTPAGSTGNQILDVVDKAGIVASVASTVIFGAALVTIPVAAPLLIGASVSIGVVGFWGIGRGVEQLVDRGIHEQTVSLANSEARNTWISIGASTLGLAAAGATSGVAALTRSGAVIGETAQLVVNITQISSLAANGIGIVNGAFHLHEKFKADTLTSLDVFQFTSSVLFFAHSTATMKMAGTIIQETQTTVLEDYRADMRSNRHRKAFDRMARNTRAGDAGVSGNAKVIKGMKSIKNTDDFFSGVVRLEKHHKAGAAKLTLTDTGTVDINGRVTVNPSTFADLPKADRTQLLDASKNLNDGTLSKAKFEKIFTTVYAPEPILSSNTMPDISDFFKSNKLAEIDTRRNTLFAFLNSVDWNRWRLLLKKELAPVILPLAIELYERLENHVSREFVDFMEFSYNKIRCIVDRLENAYEAALIVASKGSGFDQKSFDRNYGIIGERAQYFVSCVRLIYSAVDEFDEMITEYTLYHQNQVSTTNTPTISGVSRNSNNPQSSEDLIDFSDSTITNVDFMLSRSSQNLFDFSGTLGNAAGTAQSIPLQDFDDISASSMTAARTVSSLSSQNLFDLPDVLMPGVDTVQPLPPQDVDNVLVSTVNAPPSAESFSSQSLFDFPYTSVNAATTVQSMLSQDFDNISTLSTAPATVRSLSLQNLLDFSNTSVTADATVQAIQLQDFDKFSGSTVIAPATVQSVSPQNLFDFFDISVTTAATVESLPPQDFDHFFASTATATASGRSLPAQIVFDFSNESVTTAAPMQSPPQRSSSSRLRPTTISYPWDFANDGMPPDEEIFSMASDLTHLDVDETTATIRRFSRKCVVMVDESDTVVIVKFEEADQLITCENH